MIPRFVLERPTNLDEAFAAFSGVSGDAAYYAGGTELLQVMKMGFAQFDTLIDLKGIEELHGIALRDGGLWIGGTTSHAEIERSELVRTHLPGLARLERQVANARVRSTGTIGGNLAFAEPHSDPATFFLACGATIELAGPGGRRSLAIDELVIGPLFTSREPEEILLGVRVPARADGEGRGYAKIAFFERPAASVGVRLTVRDGEITAATVSVGSVGEVPSLVEPIGAAMVGAPADPDAMGLRLAAAGEDFDELEAVPDLNGSPEYKRHLAQVLVRRAAADALEEARRGI